MAWIGPANPAYQGEVVTQFNRDELLTTTVRGLHDWRRRTADRLAPYASNGSCCERCLAKDRDIHNLIEDLAQAQTLVISEEEVEAAWRVWVRSWNGASNQRGRDSMRLAIAAFLAHRHRPVEIQS